MEIVIALLLAGMIGIQLYDRFNKPKPIVKEELSKEEKADELEMKRLQRLRRKKLDRAFNELMDYNVDVAIKSIRKESDDE